MFSILARNFSVSLRSNIVFTVSDKAFKFCNSNSIFVTTSSIDCSSATISLFTLNVSFNACDFEEIQKYLFINRSCMCSPEIVKNPDYRHNINEPGTIIIT